jgi:hypothetical protein
MCHFARDLGNGENHDRRGFIIEGRQLLEQTQAVAVRQIDIEQEQRIGGLTQQRLCRPQRADSHQFRIAGKRDPKHMAQVAVVFDVQHAGNERGLLVVFGLIAKYQYSALLRVRLQGRLRQLQR